MAASFFVKILSGMLRIKALSKNCLTFDGIFLHFSF